MAFPPFAPWLLLLLSNTLVVLSVSGLNAEGVTLLSFRAAIKQDPEGSLSNWNSSNLDPCSWNGVTCKQGKVVALTIPKKRLLGYFPAALGSLSSLRHVNLRTNRFFGRLPPELFASTGIQSLVLYGNSLSGPLPAAIGNLSYIQSLDLSQNLFSGFIPASLVQCKKLKSINLSKNNFSGSLPVGFGSSLSELEKLDLSYNRLNGSIPSDIGKLSNLQSTADLSHNLFSGPVPPSLGDLPEKVYIDLSYNNLSGAIPQNGALMNRGPTAFIGNPGLCGPPLKNPCAFNVLASGPSSFPFLPEHNSPTASEANNVMSTSSRRSGLSTSVVIAIIVSDVLGIALIAMVFLYCYRRATSWKGKEEVGDSCKGAEGRKDCLCFLKDESETLSDNVEQLDLVALDNRVHFDLDELLKASAFVLGKSGIGIVYKVVLGDGLTLAVRRLGEGGSQRLKEFQTEVEAIGRVRHPNIVALRAYYWCVDEKLLIYDYIPNGNLPAAIHGKAGVAVFSPLSWDVRLKIMTGIAHGLSFLHEFSPKKYVHGDLKPNNILLGQNMEPYISDFGLGRLVNIAGGSPLMQSNQIITEKPQSQQSDISVSPTLNIGSCYHAPEAIRTLKPSQKWDVYSYGVILLELISGRSPVILLDASEMDLVQWVQFCIETKKPLSDVLDPYLARELEREDEMITMLKIALACVQTNPEQRPLMRHVVDTLDKLLKAK